MSATVPDDKHTPRGLDLQQDTKHITTLPQSENASQPYVPVLDFKEANVTQSLVAILSDLRINVVSGGNNTRNLTDFNHSQGDPPGLSLLNVSDTNRTLAAAANSRNGVAMGRQRLYTAIEHAMTYQHDAILRLSEADADAFMCLLQEVYAFSSDS
jgi:hypothetical protein